MKNIQHKKTAGFTIVELIVVIIIIGTLTAIISVSYGNYQKRSVISVVKADMINAQSAIKLKALNQNDQTPVLPEDFRSSEDVLISAYGTSIKEHCIEGGHAKREDIRLHLLSSQKEPTEGSCFENSVGPVAWWKLNGNGEDSSGFGHHATLNDVAAVDDINGNPNGAIILTSSNQFLESSSLGPMGRNITLSAWIKPTAYPSERSTILFGFGNQFYLSLSSLGLIEIYRYGTTTPGYHSTSTVAPINVWTHVMAVWHDNWAAIYMDGQHRLLVNPNTGPATQQPGSVRIGMQYASRQFYGGIDDARIYYRSLSSNEVLELYNQGPQ